MDYDFLGTATKAVADSTTSSANIPDLVTRVITIILFIAGVLAIIYLIYSGILYITAAGNPDAAKKGQQGILNAVIGIVIIVLAFFIARAVANYAQTSATGSSDTTNNSTNNSGGWPSGWGTITGV